MKQLLTFLACLVGLTCSAQYRPNYFDTNSNPFNVVPGVSVYVPTIYTTNIVTTNMSVTDFLFIGTAQVNYLTMLGSINQQGVGFTNYFMADTNYFAGSIFSMNLFGNGENLTNSLGSVFAPAVDFASFPVLYDGGLITNPEIGTDPNYSGVYVCVGGIGSTPFPNSICYPGIDKTVVNGSAFINATLDRNSNGYRIWFDAGVWHAEYRFGGNWVEGYTNNTGATIDTGTWIDAGPGLPVPVFTQVSAQQIAGTFSGLPVFFGGFEMIKQAENDTNNVSASVTDGNTLNLSGSLNVAITNSAAVFSGSFNLVTNPIGTFVPTHRLLITNANGEVFELGAMKL